MDSRFPGKDEQERRLLVCYGGTFDPVHNGHLAVACAARDVLDADVALVPAHDPPHKGRTRADAAQNANNLKQVQDSIRALQDEINRRTPR